MLYMTDMKTIELIKLYRSYRNFRAFMPWRKALSWALYMNKQGRS